MRGYRAFVGARLRLLLQYRAAALAGVTTQCFWGLIKVMILQAFYSSSSAPVPMSLAEAVGYVWLGQATFALLPWSFDGELRTMLRTGGIAYEMIRPLDLYWLWFSRNLAHRLAPTALRFLPVVLVAGLLGQLGLPPTPAAFAAWLLAIFGATLLGTALLNLVASSLLWTVAGDGVAALNGACIFVLSGMIVPLPLWPSSLRTLAYATPFPGLVDYPSRIWVGHLAPTEVLPVLAHQLVWTLLLVALGRAVLARGERRVVVQGG